MTDEFERWLIGATGEIDFGEHSRCDFSLNVISIRCTQPNFRVWIPPPDPSCVVSIIEYPLGNASEKSQHNSKYSPPKPATNLRISVTFVNLHGLPVRIAPTQSIL